MAKNKDYIVTRSNYTIKKHHASTGGSNIYERDYMATNNFGGWDSGVFPNSEGNFKMVYRSDKNDARNHNFGKPLEFNGSTDWTMNNGASQGGVTSESKILLKTDKTSLLNFACFGSCRELIKSSIRDIINKYPAEVCTKKNIYGVNGDSDYKYLLDNPFEIDMVTKKLITENEIVNPFRYFCLSYNRYVATYDSIYCGCIEWDSEVNPSFCGTWQDGGYDATIIIKISVPSRGDREIRIRRYYFGGNPYYLTNEDKSFSIRLSDADINEFFENGLDDFERVLLNIDSNPKYTAKLDRPRETERGIEISQKLYTWPTNGWNLDISSVEYGRYVEGLLELGEFYDEHYTDNLWKNMTHDSIKNMDITFSRAGSDEDKEDYNFGTTKMQGLLWAYGRQFDELKRYIDNIKSVNTITYNSNGNIPDYFLTDTLNLSGWEVSSAVANLKKNRSVKDLFAGVSKEYTEADANVEFLKNLKINSKAILSRKGTIYGVEMMLGMFGLIKDKDYKIDKSIHYATQKPASGGKEVIYTREYFSDEYLPIEDYNMKKPTGEFTFVEGEPEDTLQGLPVIFINFEKKVNGESVWYRTIVPWFKEVTELDGNPYFQMYGGWGRVENDMPWRYDETLNYIKIYKDLAELGRVTEKELYRGENVVYVYNIEGEEREHFYKNSKDEEGNLIWVKVGEDDEERVKYLEEIIDEYRGNNPHVGYGSYDGGEEYFNFFKSLLKASPEENFEDSLYDCETGKLDENVMYQGFNIGSVTANTKTYYFYDMDIYNRGELRALVLNEDKNTYSLSGSTEYVNDLPNVGYDIRKDVINVGSNRTYNSIYVEPTILNDKNLTVTFYYKKTDDYEYISKTVLPYMKQMVPSTTILKIKYENK